MATDLHSLPTHLRLGLSSLDAEHADLHQAILVLRDASHDNVQPALQALRAQAAAHFASEDQDLRQMKDGNASCHIDEHAAVLKSLDEVDEILSNAESTDDTKSRLVRMLVDELLRWLPEHVNEMDAAVAVHRSKHRFGGAPVKLSRPSAERLSA
ncbi:hemerythrin domain-containing protein [Hydrogenophaga sp. BPS33]|uniref:hemerythrin domain-containing protein n=1 Tax=Hydrogenophaga sp. BPS33 TaxID=2651974 RepID=UPI00131F664C|nr:hemerythrin domain-containing protein [Hydrogenophaga sp. BPS33]QHE85506.1 hypothetical protein F9K07_11640 [Hydrogenophaga sp. BPS33]